MTSALTGQGTAQVVGGVAIGALATSATSSLALPSSWRPSTRAILASSLMLAAGYFAGGRRSGDTIGKGIMFGAVPTLATGILNRIQGA